MEAKVAFGSGVLSLLVFFAGLVHPPRDPGIEYFLAMGMLGAYGLVATVLGGLALLFP